MKLEEKIAEAIDAWQNAAEHNPHFPEDGEQTLAQAIAQALSGICVECRELEWADLYQRRSEADPREELVGHEAETTIGFYRIDLGDDYATTPDYEKLRVNHDEADPESEYSFDPDRLKQACQADFASRWASCAKTRTVEEVRREYLDELIAHFDEAAAAEWDNAGCNDQEGGSEKDTKRFVHAAGNFQFCADQLRSLQQEGK